MIMKNPISNLSFFFFFLLYIFAVYLFLRTQMMELIEAGEDSKFDSNQFHAHYSRQLTNEQVEAWKSSPFAHKQSHEILGQISSSEPLDLVRTHIHRNCSFITFSS
jgi:hypothetical protein